MSSSSFGISKNTSFGFTLIELLVVIAIIGMLSTIVLSSLNSTRGKARDARRASDIRQIQLAVESYNDDNGHYPNTANSWSCFDCINYVNTPVISPAAANISVALQSYIKSPADPKNLGTDSGYLYLSATGVDYCIMIWRTPENLKNFGSSLVDFARCPTIDANGQCSVAGSNSIYVGNGQYAGGC